ncbi:MAG: transcriptional regulator [Robiginitomaculum sp.]|nr:MAG: transcriptional regulator [Robiginitomaculum sp.]
MKQLTAIKTLSALAHDGRLTLMRHLIKSGPEGIRAGDLALLAQIQATTATAQLLILSNAGLIGSRRTGRYVIYFPKFEHFRDLMSFLLNDCCANRKDMCCDLGQETKS